MSPAPLKQDAAVYAHEGVLLFPDSNESGSIEALLSKSKGSGLELRFRTRMSPAPLKHSDYQTLMDAANVVSGLE